MRRLTFCLVLGACGAVASLSAAASSTFHRFSTDGSAGAILQLPPLESAVEVPGASASAPGVRLVVAGIERVDPLHGRVRVLRVFHDGTTADASPSPLGQAPPVGLFASGEMVGAWSREGDLTIYRPVGSRYVATAVGRGIVPPAMTSAVAWQDPLISGHYDALFYAPSGAALYVRRIAAERPLRMPFTLPLADSDGGVHVAVGPPSARQPYPDFAVTSPGSGQLALIHGVSVPPTAPVSFLASDDDGIVRARFVDADQDGDVDLFTANVDGSVSLLLRADDGFEHAPGSPLLVGSDVADIVPTSQPGSFLALHGADGRAVVRVAPRVGVLRLMTRTFEPGSILFTVEDSKLGFADLPSMLTGLGCGADPRVRLNIDHLSTVALDIDRGQERCMLRALRRLKETARRVEPNWIARGHTVERRDPDRNPPLPRQQEWVKAMLQVPAHAAAAVTVAIIDSGAEGAHNVWRNPDEQRNGLDDDGNGYIDDLDGVDYVDGVWEEPLFRSGPNALIDAVPSGHGVAVTAAAEYIAPGIEVMSLRVLDASNQTSALDLALAILYAADNGADVINLSIAGPDRSDLVRDAVHHAWERGVTVVASAGNDGDTTSVSYPARFAGVIAVGASHRLELDGRLRVWEYSNRGRGAGFLAPGVEVCTALRCDTGTSIAAALVSGVAALAVEQNPVCPGDLLRILQLTAVDPPPLPGWDPVTGFGLVNAGETMLRARRGGQLCEPPPSEPVLPAGVLLGAVDSAASFGGVIQIQGLMTD